MLRNLYCKGPQKMVKKSIARREPVAKQTNPVGGGTPSLVLIVFLLVYDKPVHWTDPNFVIYIWWTGYI